MKHTQYTPGPWSFTYTSAAEAKRKSVDENGEWTGRDGGGADGFIFGPRGKGYDRKTIAFLPHHRNVAEDLERESNARLIAAAPDMLAALAKIETDLTALLCERVLDSTLPEFYTVRDARNAARAAIAKATGQA